MQTPCVLILTGLFLFSSLFGCGEDESALKLSVLQEDLRLVNTTIDSLNYTVDASNQLIDALRAQVDSLQEVDEKLLASMQKLSREVRQWRQLATEQKLQNEKLTAEVERMQREKQIDQQIIDQLRARSDSLNSALLAAHGSIKRRSDYLRRLEGKLGQAHDELTGLQKARVSVRLLVGTEQFMEDGGYLESSRPFGRTFRKAYKQVKKIDPEDPDTRLVPIGEAIVLGRRPRALVDRYGKLKKGQDYQESKEAGQVKITFVNELLMGTDVLVVVEQ